MAHANFTRTVPYIWHTKKHTDLIL